MTTLFLTILLTTTGDPIGGATTPAVPVAEVKPVGTPPSNSCSTTCGLEAGDVVIFKTSSIGWTIAGPLLLCGTASHAGLVVARPDEGLIILETPAIGAKVTLTDPCPRLAAYKGQVWIRRRKVPLTKEQSEKLTSFAWSEADKKYDYFGLVCLPVKMPFKLFSSCPDADEKKPSRWFCSELVAAACVSAGLLDGCKVRPSGTAPEDLRSDIHLDLSCGWLPPALFFKDGKSCR